LTIIFWFYDCKFKSRNKRLCIDYRIIIGGAIAGVSGMFLALPIHSTKVIFDRVESLEPWGYLMGDHLPKHILGATLSYRCLILNQHQKK
jgi:hypothetical protein